MGIVRSALASALACAALGSVLAITGCGGGGGDDGGAGTTPPPAVPPPAPPPASAPASAADHSLATASTDTLPTGARIDVSMRKLMPLNLNDRATFARSVGGAASGTATRQSAAALDASDNITVTESVDSTSTTERFKASTDGLVLADPLRAQATLAGAYDAFPSVVLYPSPFYAAGSTRIHFRQGSLGVDVDGDGKSDYFSATLLQKFVGFETLPLFGASVEVAHFRTEISLTTQSVATGAQKYSIRTEDVWLADNVGPVRIDRAVNVDGVLQPVVRLDLQSATIAGVQYPAPPSSINITIPLEHEFLVYDKKRGVYYASMTSSSTQANRIATINASTGAVTYSAPVGSSPKAMAVSSDGASLWVALDGTGHVARLNLPSMTQAALISLPLTVFVGPLFAEELSASPTVADAVAVSLYVKGFSPRYAGLGLIRGDVLQPTVSQTFIGANTISFDAAGSGSVLYGYNNEVSGFEVQRFDVSASGVVLRDQVSTDGGYNRKLRAGDGLILVNSKVYSATTLALLGTVAAAENCMKLPGVAKIACHTDFTGDPAKLVIVDSTSLALIATVAFAPTASAVYYLGFRLVPGATGQAAISEPDRVVLFSDAVLR